MCTIVAIVMFAIASVECLPGDADRHRLARSLFTERGAIYPFPRPVPIDDNQSAISFANQPQIADQQRTATIDNLSATGLQSNRQSAIVNVQSISGSINDSPTLYTRRGAIYPFPRPINANQNTIVSSQQYDQPIIRNDPRLDDFLGWRTFGRTRFVRQLSAPIIEQVPIVDDSLFGEPLLISDEHSTTRRPIRFVPSVKSVE